MNNASTPLVNTHLANTNFPFQQQLYHACQFKRDEQNFNLGKLSMPLAITFLQYTEFSIFATISLLC